MAPLGPTVLAALLLATALLQGADALGCQQEQMSNVCKRDPNSNGICNINGPKKSACGCKDGFYFSPRTGKCTGLPTAEGAVAWLLNTPLASVNGGGIRASWMMFTKPATFQDASQQCYLAGGDLVMPIWGAEENTAAVKWAAKWVSSPMWLGLRAPTPTKNLKDWKWVAQAGAQSQISSPMYNAWAPGYPSGTFAYAQVDPNAQWKDVDENTKLPYICELPITDFKL